MPDAPSVWMGRLRVGIVAFAAWFAFFALQGAVSHELNPAPTSELHQVLTFDVSVALLWTLFTVGILWWHELVRARATNLVGAIALHLPWLVVAALLDTIVSRIAAVAIFHMQPRLAFWPYLVYYVDLDIVCYLVVVVIAEALLVRRALVARQQLARRLESSLSRARLDYLEAQLQPHFLFNSLGAVSELAFDAPATASRVLRQLIDIFRTALARKTDEVTLGEEIVGIEPYLDIQRIRFADWLTIEYHIDDAAVDCLLPRFVLQPLIENAIRHGLSGRTSAGTIDITATVSDGVLRVRVFDNGAGLDRATSSTGRGIGLANLRDRLAILYGEEREHLRLSNSETKGAVAELAIPVRKRGDALNAAIGETPVVSIGDSAFVPLEVPSLLRRPWIAIPAIWFLWGLVWTQQSWLYDTLRHRLDRTWLSLARNDMTSALVWLLFTPIILAVAKRAPIRQARVAAGVVSYAVGGMVVAIAHIWLVQHLTNRAGHLFAMEWLPSLFIDCLIFFVLVTLSHRRLLLDWLHEREADSASLSAEVAAAQERAAKLQSIPPVLLHSLDGIAGTVRRDPSLTERQLMRLGDYLRLALECTDERGITPERERALDSAVAALRDSGAYSVTLIA